MAVLLFQKSLMDQHVVGDGLDCQNMDIVHKGYQAPISSSQGAETVSAVVVTEEVNSM